MKNRTKANGSTNDDWATPNYILKDIKKEFGEFFDPCPLKHDLNKWDGLKIDWEAVNFINPPYNNKDKVAFIRKAYEESLKGKTCILLIPVTTEIPIFHELIFPFAEIRFIQKRVKFKGYNSKGKYTENGTGQCGSMFVIFDGKKKYNNKFILDVCCGGRTFWFNKKNPNVLFLDKRKEKKGLIKDRPNFEVVPDQIMDFRNLQLEDKSFQLIVFDPPHLVRNGKNSYMGKKYGTLDRKNWKEDLRKGFNECWRVLEDHGILIFKWCSHDFKVSEVLKIFEKRPLFGHTTGKNGKTMWICFMKIPESKT